MQIEPIEIELKPGHGKAVYFFNAKTPDLTLYGCTVWDGKNGEYAVSMPAKIGTQGKYFPCVEVSPVIKLAIKTALLQAIKKLQRESGPQLVEEKTGS
jgi:hypothetical protein